MSETFDVTGLSNQYRQTLKLLVQSMSHTPEIDIDEDGLHQAISIAEDVITERLVDDSNYGYEEWKGDKKKGYPHLFQSIYGEVDLAIQRHFKISDRNFIARQFLGHVVEPMLKLLALRGPEDGPNWIPEMIQRCREAVDNKARDYTEQDAVIARHILVKRAKQRTRAIEAKKQKKFAKQIRLGTIHSAVLAIKDKRMQKCNV
jgi:hypothetical protein